MKPLSALRQDRAELPRRSRIVAHNGGRGYGGGEGAVVAILRGLAERGHSVALYCEHELVAERAATAGVPSDVFRLGGDLMVNRTLGFARMLRQQQTVALLVTTFRKFLIAGVAGQVAGVPHVIGRIGIETDLPRDFKYRWASRRLIDRIVFNAESTRQRFLEALPSLEPARALTIHGGVKTMVADRCAGVALRASLGIPVDAGVIGCAARLVPQKGFDRLLRVTSQLPEVHCLIAGARIEQDRLRELASQLRIAQRVHLLGYLHDLTAFRAALDVYTVTSDREGMSNAMLEAMAAGLPVVSTPVSGAHEALEPLADGSRPGIVTTGFGDEELLQSLRVILCDQSARKQMAQAAHTRIEERFSYDAMIDAWELVLTGAKST